MKKITFLSLFTFIALSWFLALSNDIFLWKQNIAIANSPNTSPILSSDLFHNFTSWKKGSLKNFDPLYILTSSQITTSTTWNTSTINAPKVITDVNGDGLPDIIFTNYINKGTPFTSWTFSTTYYEPQYYYALLINKWNMDYEIKYRCVYLWTGSMDQTRTWFYWDCVQ